MYGMIAAAQASAPLWKQILSDIPHDAPAFLIYALTAASIYVIWRANRKQF